MNIPEKAGQGPAFFLHIFLVFFFTYILRETP